MFLETAAPPTLLAVHLKSLLTAKCNANAGMHVYDQPSDASPKPRCHSGHQAESCRPALAIAQLHLSESMDVLASIVQKTSTCTAMQRRCEVACLRCLICTSLVKNVQLGQGVQSNTLKSRSNFILPGIIQGSAANAAMHRMRRCHAQQNSIAAAGCTQPSNDWGHLGSLSAARR